MNLILCVNLFQIEETKWQEAYETVKTIFEAFPIALMRLHEQEKYGISHYVWSRDICADKGKKTEHIEIQSDFLSRENGGAFSLYKHLSEQKKDIKKSKDEFYDPREDNKSFKKTQDVLWLHTESEYFEHPHFNCNVTVWNNGTGGAPYSWALLAAGIYLDNYFGNNAFFYGEYNKDQAQRILFWLNSVLNQQFDLPTAFHASTLWRRIAAAYPNDTPSQIIRFRSFWLGTPAEGLQFLLSKAPGALKVHIFDDIKTYQSVNQWGVINQIKPYLEATQDMEALIELTNKVQQIDPKKDFALTTLLEWVCSQSVTISTPKRHGIEQWNETGEHLVSGMETLSRLFMRMGGLPDTLNYYIHPDDLLETFAYYEPQNGEKFKNIIEKEDEKCRENIKKLENTTDQIIEKANEKDEQNGFFEIDDNLLQLSGYAGEEFIVQQAAMQMKHIKVDEKRALELGQEIVDVIKRFDQKHPYLLFGHQEKTKTDYLKRISSSLSERSIVLCDTSYKHFEKIENLQILKMIMAYVAIKDRQTGFFRTQSYLLEHPELYNLWEKFCDTEN